MIKTSPITSDIMNLAKPSHQHTDSEELSSIKRVTQAFSSISSMKHSSINIILPSVAIRETSSFWVGVYIWRDASYQVIPMGKNISVIGLVG